MRDEKVTAVLAIDQGIAVLAIMGARFTRNSCNNASYVGEEQAIAVLAIIGQ